MFFRKKRKPETLEENFIRLLAFYQEGADSTQSSTNQLQRAGDI
ncbi:hypothetical protein [Sphingorhabdus sp.]